ncbi:MAG: M28 family peptidase [Cyclobacteriaceae bacterium]|nr:M28 family peptidase [Cyclobacteriaceae bacterium]
MKNRIQRPFVYLFLLVSLYGFGQTMQKDMEYLASDKLEGREVGTKGELMAAKYVAKRFKQIGLEPKGTDGYYQEFSVKPKYNPHAKVQKDTSKAIVGRNVIGYIDNQAPTTVVIGAHFDHLGYGDEGSLSGEHAIHNGADDNASGVTVLLQVADWLKGKYTHNNYLIISFSGEEKGLWGSNWFVKHSTIDLSTVNYMLNMDMVGRLDKERKLAVYGTGTSPTWDTILDEIAKKNNVDMIKKPSGVGPSDHTSFYLADEPVLHFFTGQHDDYHKPSDDADKINYEGMKTVQSFVEDVIAAVDDKGKLEFTKTKDENSRKAPAYSVTLGVIPDYMFEGPGMRIDGVREDRPAEKAGMQKGDVVIKIDDHEVADMMGYMKVLGMYKKGDQSKVVIKRGEEEVMLDVTW